MTKIGLSEKWLNVVLALVYVAALHVPIWYWPTGWGIRETSAQDANKSLHKFKSDPTNQRKYLTPNR